MKPSDYFARRPGLWEHVLIPIMVFCWPLVYLWYYGVAINGQYLAIGNDFEILYDYKRYLLDHLVHLRMPLWSPSEAAGFVFYASPHAQALYPLNVPLALYSWVAGGYSVLDHQRFTMLGVSIFALGLYKWLRSSGLRLRPALFAALTVGVSFKVTELLRFPHAIHSAAWYPWILFAVTRIVQSQDRGQALKYAALLAFAGISLMTGGYAYFVLYAFFLFGPYLLILCIPQLRVRMIGIQNVRWHLALPAIAGAAMVAAAACGPYLYAMRSLMQQTADRSGRSFLYSTAFVFDADDTLGSLVFPPNSQAEGWYYFGIIGLLLTIVHIATTSPRFGPAPPDPPGPVSPTDTGHRSLATKVFFIAWFGTITYITWGRDSYLFILLWHYLPTFASLRVWGRFNIVLVPILAWLVAIAYQSMEHEISGAVRRTRTRLVPLAVLAISGAAILATQAYLFSHRIYDGYWTQWFISRSLTLLKRSGPFRETAIGPDQISDALAATFLASSIGAVLVLLLLFGLSLVRPFRSPRALSMVCGGLILLAALDLGMVGPFMWNAGMREALPREPRDFRSIAGASFSVPRVEGVYKFLSPGAAFHVNTVPTWYFQRYAAFRQWAAAEPEALRRLLGMVDGRRLFCTRSISHASIQAFLDDADDFSGCRVTIATYSGDRLVIRAEAPEDGYVSFIDNWEEGWQAEVDGEPAPVDVLFGTFKSVRLTKRQQDVVFVYRPRLFGLASLLANQS